MVTVYLKFWPNEFKSTEILTLTLLKWRIWWAPNNASKWQMGFNSVFKGLSKTSIYSKPMWNQWLWTPGGRKLSFPTGFFVWN